MRKEGNKWLFKQQREESKNKESYNNKQINKKNNNNKLWLAINSRKKTPMWSIYVTTCTTSTKRWKEMKK